MQTASLPVTKPLMNDLFNRWFCVLVLFHFTLWTLLPTLIRYHLPMDSIEGALWGQQLEWGYDKNPFMNAWITALAMKLSNYRDVAIYAFSQLAVSICFIATWLLARRMVSAPLAFLSVLLLEGSQYYHLHAIDLSDNLLELSVWSLTIYAFYRAVNGSKLAWCATGFIAALAMLTKYYSGFLLLSLAIFLLTEQKARRNLITLAPYIGLLIFILILLPHFMWLWSHDFITVQYMLTRTDHVKDVRSHFIFPMQFFCEQLLVALPMLILYGALFIGGRSTHNAQSQRFNRHFLFCAAWLPFILTLLASLLLNLKLHAAWGSPLLTLWPLSFFVFFKQPMLTMKKMTVMVASVFLLLCGLAVAYSLSLLYSDTPTSANFAGKTLATTLTNDWHQRYQTKLRFVAGDRFLAGSLAYYSKDHPSVWIEWDHQSSPWINESLVKKHGAIFIFYANQTIPQYVQTQFVAMQKPFTVQMGWLRNHYNVPADDISIVYVPPEA